MQPCSIATRWMPPDRSIDHDTPSGLSPPIRSITASSAPVEVLVPAELLEHAVGELGIAVLDLRAERVGAFGQQVVPLRDSVPSGSLV